MDIATRNTPFLKPSADGVKPHVDVPTVVETRGLEKTYFGKVDVHVLHNINIRIRAREFVAVIGQSGSGKPTLLNILTAKYLKSVKKNIAEGLLALFEKSLSRRILRIAFSIVLLTPRFSEICRPRRWP